MQNKIAFSIILFIFIFLNHLPLFSLDVKVNSNVTLLNKQIKVEIQFNNETNDSIYIPLSTIVLGINPKIDDQAIAFPDSTDFYFRLMIIPEDNKSFNYYSDNFDYCSLEELTDFLLVLPKSKNSLVLYLELNKKQLNSKSKYNMILSFPYISNIELQEYLLIDKNINFKILVDSVAKKYRYNRIYDGSVVIVYHNKRNEKFDFKKHMGQIRKFNKRINLKVKINQ